MGPALQVRLNTGLEVCSNEIQVEQFSLIPHPYSTYKVLKHRELQQAPLQVISLRGHCDHACSLVVGSS